MAAARRCPIYVHDIDRQVESDMAEASQSRVTAMLRGFRGHCPKCGEGKLYRRFLKPVERCAACGESLGNIRADDFPPYLTIVIVGHIVVPGILVTEKAGWSTSLEAGVWVPIALLLTFLLLPRLKGAIVGLMWSLGMTGQETQDEAPTIPTPIIGGGTGIS
jgi:uncharacterized protein (DUF983 family)